jgi:hypothetical protein
VAVAFTLVAVHYPAYATRGKLLMTDAETPQTVAQGAAQSAELVARFPHDPRAHLYRAAYFESFNDWADAEIEVRTAMTDPQIDAMGFSSSFKLGLHFELARLLAQQGLVDEAQTAAQPPVHGAAVGGAFRRARGPAQRRPLRRVT